MGSGQSCHARGGHLGSHQQRRTVALWQEFLDWFWSFAAWLESGSNLIIVIAALALVLIYAAVGRRR
jgi:hypothetical protein